KSDQQAYWHSSLNNGAFSYLGNIGGIDDASELAIITLAESELSHARADTMLSLYQIQLVDGNGKQIRVTVEVGHLSVEAMRIPEKSTLLPNYPNPFNPETWIPYQLAQPAYVAISIYNARGILIRQLELGHQAAGSYISRNRAAYWNGRNFHGEKVSSGVYLYHIEAEDFNAVGKMAVVK
ncbi:T9SS type A sorting domain-containing protein, partial [Candidatus Poribacteria bacterium]|nr:T9SS type A sorting domain-containing protein [Candidatus Poribacteria bacterium]